MIDNFDMARRALLLIITCCVAAAVVWIYFTARRIRRGPDSLGTSLQDMLLQAASGEEDSRLAEVCAACERVHRKKPRYAYALYAWAIALIMRANRAAGPDAARLYETADQKLKLALRLPDDGSERRAQEMAEFMRRLDREDLFRGNRGRAGTDFFRPHGAMLHQVGWPDVPADTSDNAGVERLSGGGSGLATAIEVGPDAKASEARTAMLFAHAYLLTGWGLNLMQQAGTAAPAEATRLYEAAEQKLTSALVLLPDDKNLLAQREAVRQANPGHKREP